VALTITLISANLALLVFGESKKVPPAVGIGPAPRLPPPDPRLFPKVNITPEMSGAGNEWTECAHGLAASGFATYTPFTR